MVNVRGISFACATKWSNRYFATRPFVRASGESREIIDYSYLIAIASVVGVSPALALNGNLTHASGYSNKQFKQDTSQINIFIYHSEIQFDLRYISDQDASLNL